MTEKITGQELVTAILHAVEREDAQFEMNDWAQSSPQCGTSLCLAGWACVINGAEPAWDAGHKFADGGRSTAWARYPDGTLVYIPAEAAYLLELDVDDGLDAVFSWSNEDALEWLRRHALPEPSPLVAARVLEVVK